MPRFLPVFSAVLALSLPALAVPDNPPPQVLATIAPLAGIAAAVTEGISTPDLLISGNASPHTYALTPQAAEKLQKADILLWAGPGLEQVIVSKSALINPAATRLGLLDEDAGQIHLATRHSALWEDDNEDEDGHGHDHGHDHHDHGAVDPHAWLEPDNAIILANRLATALASRDSAHAERYKANAAAFTAQVKSTDARIAAQLAPLATRGYMVFHDAYQYFEHHYGLKGLGALTLSPEVAPAPRHLADLQTRLRTGQVACVFAEPQFSSKLVEAVIADTPARQGLLNPDASDLAASPTLYTTYLQRLADGFSQCLTPR